MENGVFVCQVVLISVRDVYVLPGGNCRNVHFGFSERGTAITNKYNMSAVNVMLSTGRMLDWYPFMYTYVLKD